MKLLNMPSSLNLKLGTNTCPLCKKKSLKVSEYSLKCFSPSCLLNNNNTFEFLLSELGYSIKDIKKLNNKNHNAADFYERITLYNKVFDLSKEMLVKYQDISLTFLESRGFVNVLNSQAIGFLPEDKNILRKHFNTSLLEKHGLVINNFEPFSNRIIFPVYDLQNRLIHFNARSLEKEAYLRWMSSPCCDVVSPINNYLFNTDKFNTNKTVFITEGVSDGLSLLEIGCTNVFSSFGLEPRLEAYKNIWENTTKVVVIYDNDIYPENERLAGQYKSWSRIILHLCNLKLNHKHLEIIAVVPPKHKDIKDLNDWLVQHQLNFSTFKEYYQQSPSLEKFCFDYFTRNNLPMPRCFINLLASTNNSLLNDLHEYIGKMDVNKLTSYLLNLS